MESVWNIIYINYCSTFNINNRFTFVVAAVTVGELLLDDGVLQARSDPADVLLQGETVVLQLGGGDEGVVREHRPVTGLAALSRHAPHPPYLQRIFYLVFQVGNVFTFVSAIVIVSDQNYLHKYSK